MKRDSRFRNFQIMAFAFLLGTASVAWSAGPANKPKAVPAAKAVKKALTNEEIEAQATERYVEMIDLANGSLQYLRYYGEEDCPECLASSAGTGNSSLDKKSPGQICRDKWKDFYSKPVIDLRITFGYLDYAIESITGDFLAHKIMADKVTAACDANKLVRVCGFSRDPDDADIFEKKVRGPGGEFHTVRLRLTASSMTPSDVLNRVLANEQAEKSKATSKLFCDGMKEADMQLYVGHARGGGGPDFSPARRRPEDGLTDYGSYQKYKPGLEFLRGCLMDSKTPPKIVGFFACDSERWLTSLARMAPKSGLIVSAQPINAMEVGLASAYTTLDSVLWQRCEDSFNRALNYDDKKNGETLKYDGQQLLPLKIRRFFND